MDAVKFLKEQLRMYHSIEDCEDCPLGDDCSTGDNAERKVKIVEEWSKEHPVKTRMTEFLKQYPNAALNPVDKLPGVQPCILDYSIKERLCKGAFSCSECREKYWLEEIE